MSRRSLGGGRVLGSGKHLSPAISSAQHQRQTSSSSIAGAVNTSTNTPSHLNHVISPSVSSISLNSQTSASQVSDPQDITSHLSLDNVDVSGSTAAAAAASARLMCPICNEEMVTLLQLNRHLDDAHKNLEDERQDEVKDWFKSQMVKAKKFQPLAVLNQKLKGLEVFESNNDQPPPGLRTNPGAGSAEPIRIPDPDEVVTREHWQRGGPQNLCSEPTCGKRLTTTNGCINCRHCGKLFCEEHTMYQMKLSRSAQHEPVRGFWCRVCETCYKSREGYNDHHGFGRDHTEDFIALRRKHVDKAFLEVTRLEKRLSKLTQLLANPPAETPAPPQNNRWSLIWPKDQTKSLEQTVVAWEDDTSVAQCPFCQQEFSSYTFRRHHCRTCGRVVCGDPATECSTEVGLTVATADTATEKPQGEVNVDVRLCKDCKFTLFSRRDFEADMNKKAPIIKAYGNLIQFERGIRLMLPKFQKLLQALQDPDKPPSQEQLNNASKIRRRLTDAFTQYDIAARRIRDLPTASPSEALLQKNIHIQASHFLQLHMLPLKAVPKVLKHSKPQGRPLTNGHSNSASNIRPSGHALAKIGRHDTNDSSSQISSGASSAISALEAEEKSLRERLIVLEEQKFLVSEMLSDANKRRNFDEAAALRGNLDDLEKEIDSVQGMVGQLDFEGVYNGRGDGSLGLESPRFGPLRGLFGG